MRNHKRLPEVAEEEKSEVVAMLLNDQNIGSTEEIQLLIESLNSGLGLSDTNAHLNDDLSKARK